MRLPLAAPALPSDFSCRVLRYWFIAVDTARLRAALRGRLRIIAERELAETSLAVGARVVVSCAIPCGVRSLLTAQTREHVQTLIRRFRARTGSPLRGAPPWRARALVAAVAPRDAARYAAFVRRCAEAFPQETQALATMKKGGAAAARRAAAHVRDIERAVDQLIGTDDAARRCRRYVADHDAPADDQVAFARLCMVVFAQGLGFGPVDAKLEQFNEAFEGFAPDRVATFDDARIARVLEAPIIRNEVKIRACVENARRWLAASGGTSYLGKIAEIAASDDAAGGWPSLVERLQADFARIGETAARQTLKRWGFFTAFAHPGSRRVLERLHLIDEADAPAAVQCFVGAIARNAGRDAYQLEASLALFASLGPCKREPACDSCALAEKCPTGLAGANVSAHRDQAPK